MLLFLAVRKTKILRNRFGITACIMVCVCLYIRMLVPFDVGLFQKVNVDWEWFRRLYDIINLEKLFLGRFSLSQVLCVVWIAAAVFFLLRWGYFYRTLWRGVSAESGTADERILSVLEKVIADGGFRIRPKIIISPNIRTPYSIGLLHCRILMPEREYSSTELYYIFFHEMTHFRKGDLWMKAAANIMCSVFWWNPLVFVLRRELETALEIRCDASVTSGRAASEKQDYLRTLLKVLKTGSAPAKKPDAARLFRNAAGMVRPSAYETMMKERFETVAGGQKSFGERKILSVVWSAAMLCVMLLSYMFVVFPYYAPEFEAGYTKQNRVYSEDIQAVKQENGMYEITFLVQGEKVKIVVDEAGFQEFKRSRQEEK